MTSKSVSLQEAMEQENRRLRAKLEKLEKEHRDLKRAYFELSLRQGQCANANGDLYRAKEAKDGNVNGDSEPDVRSQYIHNLIQNDHLPSIAGHEEVATPDAGKRFDVGRILSFQHDLCGHYGAVYSIKFNKRGNLLASGGFDKTVRIWNLDNAGGDKVLQDCYSEHGMYVSDVAWSVDGIVASTSYDKTVKWFDVGASRLVGSADVEGFGLALVFSPADPALLVAGTSQNAAVLLDTRAGRAAMRFANDAMVNAVEADADAGRLLTGDARGVLKAWDMRGRLDTALWSIKNGLAPASAAGRAVSHLHLCRGGAAGGEEGPPAGVLAASSYDGLHVYALADLASDPAAAAAAAAPPLRMLQVLRGHRTANLPIRSSVHLGPGFRLPDPARSGKGAEECSGRGRRGDAERCGLVATGSGDDAACVYALDGPAGVGEPVQRLEGHRDRVYSAQFHPARLELATCSADSLIKLWAPPH